MNSNQYLKGEDLRDYFKLSREGSDVDEGLIEVGFGEYLVERRVISREELLRALQVQDRNPGVRLGECIAALGLLTTQQIDTAIRDFHSVSTVEI